jgi:nitrous oxidase accessory protein NosD
MRKIAILIVVFVATVLSQLCSVPAYAQYTLWVSHTGSDSNNCSEGSPCLTFAGALAKASGGGVIQCLDAGFYGAAVISMSVTIDCHGLDASIFGGGNNGNGIDIAAGGGTVTLRGLFISAAGAGGNEAVFIASATTVYIEDCAIMGFEFGIFDARSTGLTQLFVKNTVIRNNAVVSNSAGIQLVAAPRNSVVLENVQLLGNGYGILVGTGNNVIVSRSVISGNTTVGIEVNNGGFVYVDNSEISHNGFFGIQNSGGTAVLAGSDIVFNSSSINGPTLSFGNNRIFGNGAGTAPTPVGGASTDFGQQ